MGRSVIQWIRLGADFQAVRGTESLQASAHAFFARDQRVHGYSRPLTRMNPRFLLFRLALIVPAASFGRVHLFGRPFGLLDGQNGN